MDRRRAAALEAARAALDLTAYGLWVDYLALGGNLPPDELSALLSGSRPFAPHDYDIVTHALNERFADRQQDHPLPYAEDLHDRS